MYRIKPHEILHRLGFKGIGEEGLSINPNDAFLYDSALALIGKSLKADLDAISPSDFDMFKNLAVFADSDESAERFIKNHNPEKARELVRVILNRLQAEE